ncbi:hypothetical protein [Phenylobacterium sp.]|uniref:hypothetical protein n=1 Tax=Phenylobacterium sp. TaxID=1871053 RepID=UPI00261537FD|nr:hypothetical protein [Phenylobacterium sp.]
MAAIADVGERKLDIGRVIAQTFSVLRTRGLLIFGLTLVLAGLPAVANLYFMRSAVRGGVAALNQLSTVAYWFRLTIGIFVGSYLAVCLFFVAFSEASGRQVSLGEIAARGLRLFLPLFIVNLLTVIAVVFGCFLLIVPGLFLATMWCVTGPALVAEPIGMFQAWGRSAELTRNNRWRIFGLFAIVFVVLMIIDSLLGFFNVAALASGQLFSPMRLLTTVLISIIFSAITYTGLAVLYAELRQLKDGAGGESLAAVFD